MEWHFSHRNAASVMVMPAASQASTHSSSVRSEIVILFGLARRTARKSRKYHYSTGLVPVAVEVHLVVLEPALGNLLDGLVLAREHARGERVVGDEADAELAQAREQLALDLAC